MIVEAASPVVTGTHVVVVVQVVVVVVVVVVGMANVVVVGTSVGLFRSEKVAE